MLYSKQQSRPSIPSVNANIEEQMQDSLKTQTSQSQQQVI
jgi:hypothetical protein